MDIKLISGKKLKILLKRKGISQQELIKKFGFHQTTISRYFTDDQAMPASFIIKVAAYAGLTLDQLTEGHIEPAIIDVPHMEVAAEPVLNYIPEPAKKEVIPPPPPPETSRPVIRIDTSDLEHKLSDLYHKIEEIQQELSEIKHDIQLIHH
jgi:transcriptional regulator with XRE-family HTH domain